LVTGTTFVWSDKYEGYVNFELGMYYIPAEKAKFFRQNYIFDPASKRVFVPHLQGWFDHRDQGLKPIPKLANSLEGTRAKGKGGKPALALPSGKKPKPRAKPKSAAPTEIAGVALPLDANGEVIGFASAEERGFAGLTSDPSALAERPPHRSPDIIAAGLKYVATLPESEKAGALQFMELQLRLFDKETAGRAPDKQSVLDFLQIRDFWEPSPEAKCDLTPLATR
jgi:hypothetical protein